MFIYDMRLFSVVENRGFPAAPCESARVTLQSSLALKETVSSPRWMWEFTTQTALQLVITRRKLVYHPELSPSPF
jgi:hypothetical protein